MLIINHKIQKFPGLRAFLIENDQEVEWSYFDEEGKLTETKMFSGGEEVCMTEESWRYIILFRTAIL